MNDIARYHPFEGPLRPVRTNSVRQSKFRLPTKHLTSPEKSRPSDQFPLHEEPTSPLARKHSRSRIMSFDASRLASARETGLYPTSSNGVGDPVRDENVANDVSHLQRSRTVTARPLPAIPPSLAAPHAAAPLTNLERSASSRDRSSTSPPTMSRPRIRSLGPMREDMQGSEVITRYLSSLATVGEAPAFYGSMNTPGRSESPSLPPPPRSRNRPTSNSAFASPVGQGRNGDGVTSSLGLMAEPQVLGPVSSPRQDVFPERPTQTGKMTINSAFGGIGEEDGDEPGYLTRTRTSSLSSKNHTNSISSNRVDGTGRRGARESAIPLLPPPSGPVPDTPQMSSSPQEWVGANGSVEPPLLSSGRPHRLSMQPSLAEFAAGPMAGSRSSQPPTILPSSHSMHSQLSNGSQGTHGAAPGERNSRGPSRQNSVSGRSGSGHQVDYLHNPPSMHAMSSPPVAYGQHPYSSRSQPAGTDSAPVTPRSSLDEARPPATPPRSAHRHSTQPTVRALPYRAPSSLPPEDPGHSQKRRTGSLGQTPQVADASEKWTGPGSSPTSYKTRRVSAPVAAHGSTYYPAAPLDFNQQRPLPQPQPQPAYPSHPQSVSSITSHDLQSPSRRATIGPRLLPVPGAKKSEPHASNPPTERSPFVSFLSLDTPSSSYSNLPALNRASTGSPANVDFHPPSQLPPSKLNRI